MPPPPSPETLAFALDRRLTTGELRAILADPTHPERLELAALLLREARPAEVWRYLTPREVGDMLPDVAARLGRQRAFCEWLIATWRRDGRLERAL